MNTIQMNRLQVGVAIALTSLSAHTAWAAGSGAHGGDAVVCFSIPVERAMKEGMMTLEGRKSIVSAVTNEFHQNRVQASKNPAIERLMKMSFKDALTELHAMVAGLPDFHRVLKEAQAYFGTIDEGFPADYGIEDVRDSGTGFGLPDGCALVQAALRREDHMSYDPDVWKAFTGFQQALMQLHEEVYYVAADNKHENSVRTQLLIGYLLQGPITDEGLSQKLSRYAFFWEWGQNLSAPFFSIAAMRVSRDTLVAQHEQVLSMIREGLASNDPAKITALSSALNRLSWDLGGRPFAFNKRMLQIRGDTAGELNPFQNGAFPRTVDLAKIEANREELLKLFP